MHHKYAAFIRFINIVYDFVSLNLVLAITTSIYFSKPLSVQQLSEQKFVVLWLNFLWLISSFFGNLYLFRNLVYFTEGIKRSMGSFMIFIFLELFFNFLFFNDSFLDQKLLFEFILGFAFFFWIARLLFYMLKKIYSLELFSGKRVILVGDDSYVSIVEKVMKKKREVGFVFAGSLQENIFTDAYENGLLLLFKSIKDNNAEEVFFIKSLISNEHLYDIIQSLDKQTIRVRIIPDFSHFFTKPQNLSFIGDIPLLSIRREPLESLFNRMFKRMFDFFFSIFVIIALCSWLFLILAILIKLESRGPVFFKQKRSGRDNKSFWCFKFRSMRANEESDYLQAKQDDQRITRVGAFLRKTSIDELPQFFNVLFGNMSIVGPRPHMLIQTVDYSNLVDKYMIRHFVKPGITGWAQVNGYRGEIVKAEDLEKRVEHDIWYLENWSILLDVQVILLTVYHVIVGQKNAY